MKPGLTRGDVHEFSLTVTEAMRAHFNGIEVHPLYATATMISHMEWAARQHILPYLAPGEEGVGCHVDVRHLAPTPIGAVVRIRSTVTDIQPDRVVSHVEAWNALEKIGDGTFVQALVKLDDLYARCRALDPADDQPSDARRPAALPSPDGQTGMELLVEGLETQYACTRYDEWMRCRLLLYAPGFRFAETGPFLLRYEVEDWMAALERGEVWESDFLESPFQCRLAPNEAGTLQLTIKLDSRVQLPDALPVPDTSVSWPVSRTDLVRFARQVASQLDRFPSVL